MSILKESLAGRLAVPVPLSGAGTGGGAGSGSGAGAPPDAASLAPQGGLSYVRGPVEPPLVYQTIPQMFNETVSRFGPNDAVVFCEQNVRMSYYDLAREVDQLAAGLLALGLNKGDRAGIWSPNRIEWVLTQLATARIGVVLVNINPACRTAELEYALNKSGCKALITARAFKSSDYPAMIKSLAPELDDCAPGGLRAAKLPHLKYVAVTGDDAPPGMLAFDALMQLGGPAQKLRLSAVDETLNPDDAINIQFTSGTTGAPKGASLSHYNIVNNARFVVDRINLGPGDRLAVPVPLYHCFGMVMGVLGALSRGAALVFPGESFEPDQVLDALAGERCTALYGVPAMFIAMLEKLEQKPRDLSAMRTGVMAGALCPADVMRKVTRDMNMREVTIAYGMTETSPVSFQSFVDDPADKRCETVGRVHPHLEVKIIDAEGRIVPAGEQGELCTRGYSVMKGYWDDPEKTAESVVDGWMRTGDLAVIDGQGFCAVTGRVKDMIIRGGENIYPREVEDFLITHPDISGAQVFGLADEKYGEEVCAWVTARPGCAPAPGAVRDWCKDRIAHFKVPKHVRVVDELPMTVTGKPQKFVMRERMAEMLAAGA